MIRPILPAAEYDRRIAALPAADAEQFRAEHARGPGDARMKAKAKTLPKRPRVAQLAAAPKGGDCELLGHPMLADNVCACGEYYGDFPAGSAW